MEENNIVMDWLVWGFLLFLAAPFLWKILGWFFTLSSDDDETQTKGGRRRRGATVPRGDVLKAIRDAGGKGIGRAGIIQQLGVKGDKTAENSVTYQLRELKEGRRVRHEGRRYFAR